MLRLSSELPLFRLTAKIFRAFRILRRRNSCRYEPLNTANNRDFRFYATINRGLLVPSREFTSTVTYKLAGIVLPFFARFARRVRCWQAYYNVTVTFYVAHNSDIVRYRTSARASASVFTAVAAYTFGQTSIIAPLFLPPGPDRLVYATSRSKRPCRLCLTIGNGYGERAIYANRDFVRMMRSYSGSFHAWRKRGRTETKLDHVTYATYAC